MTWFSMTIQRYVSFPRFIDFDMSPRPEGIEGYKAFREKTIEFVHSRNARIASLNG